MRTVIAANRKGGVGKTTVSDLIALYYSTIKQKRVLALDFDSSNCSFSKKYINMNKLYFSEEGSEPPQHPNYESMKDQYTLWDGISSSADIFSDNHEKNPIVPYPTNINNLEILPASTKELELIEEARGEHLKEIFEKLKNWINTETICNKYDLVIIDTPPIKNNTTRAAMKAATDLLIPTALESTPMEGVFGMLQVFNSENMYRKTHNKLNLIGIVANLYERYSIHDAHYEELKSYASTEKYLIDIKLHKYKDYAEYDHARLNQKKGNFFIDYDTNNKARKQALAFCDEINRRISQYGEI